MAYQLAMPDLLLDIEIAASPERVSAAAWPLRVPRHELQERFRAGNGHRETGRRVSTPKPPENPTSSQYIFSELRRNLAGWYL